MADYSELKQNIASVIKSNNRREITGQILQNVLNQMVGSLGENYQLAGFAEPTTNPQQPDQTLFYIAEQAGVYTNFDNITLDDGLSFLMWKNSEWTSHTIGVATHSWVDSNYVSKAFLRQIFRVYDADGFEILPNDTTSIADNIKAMVGLWTNEYLSALGLGDDGQTGAQYLTQLGDVEIDSTTLANGQVLVYDNGLWVNGTAGGVDMSVVWAALAGNTNEQINASHLTTALTGYVTSSSLSTTLADYVTTTALSTALASYASQSWVSQNYVSIAFLNRILRAYDSTDTQVQPNDTTTAIDNLKAMVGLWTEQYLSALGRGNDGGGGGYITTLAQLEDVELTTPSVGQALVYAEVESGVYKWVNGTAGVDMTTVWSALGGNTNEQIALSHLTTALSGYVTTSGLSTTLADYVTSTALSTTLADYVTSIALSTTLASYATQQWVGQNYISIAFFNRLFAAYDSSNVIINPNDTTTAVDNIKALVGLWTQQYLSALGQGSDGGGGGQGDVTWALLADNTDTRQIALSHLTSALTGYATQSWVGQQGYITGITSSMVTSALGYTPANSTALSNYLPLSGGTMTGTLHFTTSAALPRNPNFSNMIVLDDFADGGTIKWASVDDVKSVLGLSSLNYLPLSGGTLSSDSRGVLTLENITNNTGKGPIIDFKINGTTYGYAGYYYDGTQNFVFLGAGGNRFYLDSSGGARIGTDSTNYTIYHTGNLSPITTTNWSSYIGTSSSYVGYASYATSAGSATTAGTATYAGQLSTARSLWGNSFDGTSDINGNISIYATGSNFNEGIRIHMSSNGFCGVTLCDSTNTGSTGTSANTWSMYNYNGTFGFAKNASIYSDDESCLCCDNGLRWGIGTNLPQAKLDVRGKLRVFSSAYLREEVARFMVYDQSPWGISLYCVNSSNGAFNIQVKRESGNSEYMPLILNHDGENVGVGYTDAPSYKLHVVGDIYATGGVTSLSDIRKKDVLSYELPLSVEQIAAAPTIKFLWKDKREEGEQVGTIAQYWEKVLPQVIKDKSGELSMGYGVTALIAATIDARKIVDHEKRLDEQEALIREQGFKISELQRECAELRNENEILKLKIA